MGYSFPNTLFLSWLKNHEISGESACNLLIKQHTPCFKYDICSRNYPVWPVISLFLVCPLQFRETWEIPSKQTTKHPSKALFWSPSTVNRWQFLQTLPDYLDHSSSRTVSRQLYRREIKKKKKKICEGWQSFLILSFPFLVACRSQQSPRLQPLDDINVLTKTERFAFPNIQYLYHQNIKQ